MVFFFIAHESLRVVDYTANILKTPNISVGKYICINIPTRIKKCFIDLGVCIATLVIGRPHFNYSCFLFIIFHLFIHETRNINKNKKAHDEYIFRDILL